MAWRIEYSDGARRQLKKLDGTTRREIVRYMDTRIAQAEDPKAFGHALHYDLAGLWRFRVGVWRIVCLVDSPRGTVRVVTIGHRREVYD